MQPNPTQQVASPLPKGTQILIHPEHEKGNLVIPTYTPPTLSDMFNRKTLTLMIIFGILLFLISFVWLVLIPRSQSASFAYETKEVVSASSEKVETIHNSLNILYQAVTEIDESDASLSNHDTAVKKNNRTTKIFHSVQNLLEQLKDVFAKESVKGFSIPKSDPHKEMRQQRDLAVAVEKKVSEYQETQEKFTKLLSINAPASADLTAQIFRLNETTRHYLDQAAKTSDYYISLSDTSIELSNLAASTVSIRDLETTLVKLDKLRSRFADNTGLPEGIEKYNANIVEVFDLLINFYQEIQKQGLMSASSFLTFYDNFISGLQTIALRANSNQVSFWQNNKAFSGYDDLINQHTQVLKNSDRVWERNKFFLLEWLKAD